MAALEGKAPQGLPAAMEGPQAAGPDNGLERGVIVKLDRGFPLVRLSGPGADRPPIRCEHATALVKGKRMRGAIGDSVLVSLPDGHDKGIIEEIEPRATAFVRKDPAERTAKQVLAANFDQVIIAEPIVSLNERRLERELVLAHETGARVLIALTKTDLDPDAGSQVAQRVRDLAGRDVEVLGVSIGDEESIEQLRAHIPEGSISILIGKSGVGKSSLVNALAGRDVQQTAQVREADGKGRHTTVDRVLVPLPNAGTVVDMPGVRGLGLWDADQGLSRSFSDVEELAARCRFRDCTHTDEPGCAVLSAVESGELPKARLESYRSLASEIEQVRTHRDEARRLRGEKASDRRKHTRKKKR